MATVYLIQNPPPIVRRDGPPIHKDLSTAARYGRIEVLLEDGLWASTQPDYALRQIRSRLSGFEIGDMLCFAGGDPLGLALAFVALIDLGHNEVNYLRWERELNLDGERTGRGFYVPTIINIEEPATQEI